MNDRREYYREYRRRNRAILNEKKKEYRRSKFGKLTDVYNKMAYRVAGREGHRCDHLYKGLPIIEKEAFYEWSLKDEDYNSLHDAWVESDYEYTLCPSIDRIDPKKGYTIDNMQWITVSENAKRSNY